MSEKIKSETERAVSPGLGNLLAAFVVPPLVAKGYIEISADSGLTMEYALLAGGAIIGTGLMYIRSCIRWAANLIERIVDRRTQ